MLKAKSSMYSSVTAFHYISTSTYSSVTAFPKNKRTTQLFISVMCKRNLNIDNDNGILPLSHKSDIGSFSHTHSEFAI